MKVINTSADVFVAGIFLVRICMEVSYTILVKPCCGLPTNNCIRITEKNPYWLGRRKKKQVPVMKRALAKKEEVVVALQFYLCAGICVETSDAILLQTHKGNP